MRFPAPKHRFPTPVLVTAGRLRQAGAEIDGSTARVRTTVTVFNAPIATEHDLVLLEGRWYGKEAAENFDVAEASDS